MKNNYQYDVVCTIAKGTERVTWRSTDGYIYSNDECLNKEEAYKAVRQCYTCKNCPAQDKCLREILDNGKTEY